MRPCFTVWLGCAVLALAGCSTMPESEAFFEPVSLKQRQTQTRFYEAVGDIRVLQACIALLLDNGFQINQVENRLGWVHAYKVAHSNPLNSGAFSHLMGVFYATVVTRTASNRPGVTQVRVTFHGADYADVSAQGDFHLIDNPVVYQDFFNRLSKALFLKAQRT